MQFPKDQRNQNAYEFIEQKKEMFLVQLSHNTIQKEIDLLQNKIDRKAKALDQSKKLLNQDEREVRDYVEKINKETKDIEKAAESAQTIRKEKEESLKGVETEINQLNYQSSKNNQDSLESLEAHKKFLEELSDQDFIKKKYETQKQKIEALKTKWIKEHKSNSSEDHIIFAEEIEAQQSMAQDGKRKEVRRVQDNPQKGTIETLGKRDFTEFRFQRPEMTEADWEAKFRYCLDNFLINVPEGFYSEEIQFKDPDEISEKFAELEEKNLFLIHARQETEQSLEELKNEYKQTKKELTQKKQSYEKKLKELEENEKGYQDNFRTKGTRFDIDRHSKLKDGDEEVNVFNLLNQLREKIEMVYKKTKTEKIDLTAKGTIDMLSEIETTLDTKITELTEFRDRNEGEVKASENRRKVARKEKKLKETGEQQLKEDLAKRERANKASKAKESAEFKGKKPMERSKKKSIKKRVVKTEVDPQIEERKRYIGDIF